MGLPVNLQIALHNCLFTRHPHRHPLHLHYDLPSSSPSPPLPPLPLPQPSATAFAISPSCLSRYSLVDSLEGSAWLPCAAPRIECIGNEVHTYYHKIMRGEVFWVN